jgi:MFS family permease
MTPVLRPYSDILARPGALTFSAAGGIARLPMSMTGIGIVLLVSAVYGSYGLAGTVSAVHVVATAVCSPHVARLVDRYGQARVMRPLLAVAATALAGLIVAATTHAPTWMLYVTAAVSGATLGSMGAMVRARWTNLLPDSRRLHTAFSLESVLDDVVFAVGPVAATLLATSVAPSAGLVLALVAATVGGYWFLAQRGTEPPVRPRPDGVREGSAIRSGVMLTLAAIFTTIGGVFGATNVATVAFAEEQGRTELAGPVLAGFAVASVVSGLLYGSRHWTSPMWRRFLVGVVALAAGTSLFVLVETLGQLALVMFVAGFAIAPTLVTANGLIQRVVPATRLTEGLTWGGTALGVGVAIGSSSAGRAIDAFGARAGYLVVVAAAGCAVVLALASVGTFRRRAAR